jgi:cytochrome c oxidase subunit III
MSSAHASAATVEGAPPEPHHMDVPTAYQSAKMGMWLFLGTEILLFGGLFTAFALYHWWYFAEFHHASKNLDWRLGSLNTAVLLFSSFTAALAVDAAQHGNNKKVLRYLGISIACGVIFLIIKYFEWESKYHHGLFPGTEFFNSKDFAREYKMYFGLYYCMTGLHALHVIAGMGLMIWAANKARRRAYSSSYYTPVELSALYWHLVDLIWIYLFPLLYLVG